MQGLQATFAQTKPGHRYKCRFQTGSIKAKREAANGTRTDRDEHIVFRIKYLDPTPIGIGRIKR
ncbi:MAG: hypothetical protein EBT41_00655 [Betaproteobacteria bacterium]|nr:hypothetical protein [Betaproteobacteria bacterium]